MEQAKKAKLAEVALNVRRDIITEVYSADIRAVHSELRIYSLICILRK